MTSNSVAKLHLFPSISYPSRRLRAYTAISQKVGRIAQRNFIFGRLWQTEQLRDHVDEVCDDVFRDAVVGYVEKSDGDKGIVEFPEKGGFCRGGVGEGEVDCWDRGESEGRCHFHVFRGGQKMFLV